MYNDEIINIESDIAEKESELKMDKELFKIVYDYIDREDKRGLFAGAQGKIVKRTSEKYGSIVNGSVGEVKDACYSLSSMIEHNSQYIKDKNELKDIEALGRAVRGFNYKENHFLRNKIDQLYSDKRSAIVIINYLLLHMGSTCSKIEDLQQRLEEIKKESKAEAAMKHANSVSDKEEKEDDLGLPSLHRDKKDKGLDMPSIGIGLGNKKAKELDEDEIRKRIYNFEHITEEEYNFVTKHNIQLTTLPHLFSYKNYLKMVDLKKLEKEGAKDIDIGGLLKAANDIIALCRMDLLGKTIFDEKQTFNRAGFDVQKQIDNYREIYKAFMKNYDRLSSAQKNDIGFKMNTQYSSMYNAIIDKENNYDFSVEKLNPDTLVNTINSKVSKAMIEDEDNYFIDMANKSTSSDRILYAAQFMSENELIRIYHEIADKYVEKNELIRKSNEYDLDAEFSKLSNVQEIFVEVIAKRIMKENKLKLDAEQFEKLKTKICIEKLKERVKFKLDYSFNPQYLDSKNKSLEGYDLSDIPMDEPIPTEVKDVSYGEFLVSTSSLEDVIKESESLSERYSRVKEQARKMKQDETSLSPDEKSSLDRELRDETKKMDKLAELRKTVEEKASEYESLDDYTRGMTLYATRYEKLKAMIKALENGKLRKGSDEIDLGEVSTEEINKALGEVEGMDFGGRSL